MGAVVTPGQAHVVVRTAPIFRRPPFLVFDKRLSDELNGGSGGLLKTSSVNQMPQFISHGVNVNTLLTKTTEAARIDALFVSCSLVRFCGERIEDERLHDGLFIVAFPLRVLEEVCTAPHDWAGVKTAVQGDEMVSKFVGKLVLFRRESELLCKFVVILVNMDARVAPLVVVGRNGA